MVEHIHKCVSCNKYTLKESCPDCGSATILPRPPKYSSEDKYAQMKREIKKEELKKKNLY
jgi:H/ACA ribonucleoprotein complex subunit 3